MVLCGVYFDDSGSWGDTKMLVVCGFVSTVEQWLLFERDWNFILHMPQFDLEHLHMKELRTGKGRFAKFKDNRSLQRDLFDRLQRTIKCRTQETFAVAVFLDDYDRVNSEYELEEKYGAPILMASQFAIGKVTKWFSEHRPNDALKIVFDQGIEHWGILDGRVYQHYGFRLIPAVVKETPPLQACDHAAWELHRVLSTVGLPAMLSGQAKRADYRGSFLALFERLSMAAGEDRYISNWIVYDEAELRVLCEAPDGPRKRK